MVRKRVILLEEEKVKLYMTSGTILYRPGNEQVTRSQINSSNARGAAVASAYLDEACTQHVQVALANIEYFHGI